MAHIVAGHFQQQEQAQHAVDQLVAIGIPEDQISRFYVNPPGQHDLYPIGGDRDTSPGAEKSGDGVVRGIAAGSVIGAGVGMAGVAVAGPISPVVGALVGAHVGSLIGSMAKMKERDETEQEVKSPRQSGLMVAGYVTDNAHESSAIEIFRRLGADQIERANGTIKESDWEDFNPLTPPQFL